MAIFILIIILLFFSFTFTVKKPVQSFGMVIMLYLIIPPSVAFPVSFLGLAFILSLPRIYFIGLLLGFFVSAWMGKIRISIVKSTSDKVLVLLILYLIISFYWGISLLYDLKIFFSEQWFLGFLGYFIASNIITSEKSLWYILKKVFISIIILSLYGFLEILSKKTITDFPVIRSFTGIDLQNSKYIHSTMGERGGFLRPSGTFWNNIIYGIALTLYYPYFLNMKKVLKNKWNNIGLIFASLGGLATISRTAWFSIIYAFGLNFKKYKYLTITVLIIFFIVFLPFLNSSFNKSGYIDKSGLSMESRLVVLTPVFNDLKFSKLLTGYGVGSYIYSITKVNDIEIQRLPSDNSLAQRVFTTGIIGVFLFFLFLFYYYRDLTKATKNDFLTSVSKATGQMILIQLTLFLVSNSLFQDPRLSFVFFSTLGAIKGTTLK